MGSFLEVLRVMDRMEWLKEMRRKAEILYNHGVEGFGADEEAPGTVTRRP